MKWLWLRSRWFLIAVAATLSSGLALALLALDLWTPEGPNYSLIEDGLYMGGFVAKPPPRTKAVLNLCRKEDPYRADVYLWEPISDNDRVPSLDWLRKLVEFVEDNRRTGRTTFIHCRNGISRSSLVVVAYLMHKNHWTRDRTLKFVRPKWSIARPNSAFMKLLLEWEHTLQ